MTRHTICKANDVKVGQLTPANIGRASIVLVRLPSGDIRAVSGYCPHQSAPLQHGCVSGMTEGDVPNELTFGHCGEVLRCPWHGFEYSLVTGEPLVPAPAIGRPRLRIYDVEIEGDDVVVLT